MDSKLIIRHTIDMANHVVHAYLDDLGDADLLLRPVAGMNHLAWQLGHLIASEKKMIEAAGYTMPDLPEGFADAHGPETAGKDAGFLSKDAYFTLREKIRAATLTALEGASAEDLAKPTEGDMQQYAPTVGAVFNMIGFHDLMHAGQWVAVRRKLNKPVTI